MLAGRNALTTPTLVCCPTRDYSAIPEARMSHAFFA